MNVETPTEAIPRPADRPEFAWMLDMLGAALGDRRATYVSVPITTGPRLVEWYRQLAEQGRPLPDPRRPEGNDERRQAVIEPNLRDAAAFVAEVRRRVGSPSPGQGSAWSYVGLEWAFGGAPAQAGDGTAVIDPSRLRDVPGWRQEDYIAFWEAVIERFAGRVVLAQGWNYSFGCAHEFLYAVGRGLPTLDADIKPLPRAAGLELIRQAAQKLAGCGADISFLEALLAEAGENPAPADRGAVPDGVAAPPSQGVPTARPLLFKDEVLDWLAERGNVAQFVSFDPAGGQRFCRLKTFARNHRFDTMEGAVASLFRVAGEGKVNVRSFRPESPQGNPFKTRLASADEAVREIRDLSAQGLYCICNELVDEKDGGVSGVAHGDWLEVAPDIFPRDVGDREVAALPRLLGLKVLERVYGHRPMIDYPRGQRVEFTVTVSRRGHRAERTLVWEVEDAIPPAGSPALRWPNPLSRLVGDKAWGLVVADALGFLVPFTTVVARRIPVFSFGRATGSQEHWLRTCPVEPVPGFYTTRRGWADPYDLLQREDPAGRTLASVLCQEAVPAAFSGKTLTRENRQALVEGVRGEGAAFMVGQPPQDLPAAVKERVCQLQEQLLGVLGPVSFEWVDDGRRTWVIQLHVGASSSSETVIFEGEADQFFQFRVSEGLEALYRVVKEVKGTGQGILLVGPVGVTSHFGDLLRRERIPSRIVSA
jgi:hypothetical protein